MYQIDFNQPIHIHFIGIGGISMSGLAEVLLKEGFRISGSDAHSSELTAHLKNVGATIHFPQAAENITDDIDAIVYTAAIHPDNPEFIAAVATGKPMLTRAELLGQMMQNYKHAVAVAGTHGKTTTTSMAAHILMACNADPTVSVGGILPSIGGNIRIGHSDMFLTEACEYTNSFLSLAPTIGIVLNMDADHLDFFKDIYEIRKSFHRFAKLIPENGTLIINRDTPSYETVAEGLSCRVLTYSVADSAADISAEDIIFDELGNASFTCLIFGEEYGRFTLSVPGMHNVSNALSAIAMAYVLSLPASAVKKGLASFHGTDRRFQHKGRFKGAEIIDDYAHHPTEIAATLKTAANFAHQKLWCVFQPHTYSRTKSLMEDFASVLSEADAVILAKIYPARETDDLGISSATLQKEIIRHGGNCIYLESFAEIEDYLTEHVSKGDMILTVGAGDVVKIGEDLLREGED